MKKLITLLTILMYATMSGQTPQYIDAENTQVVGVVEDSISNPIDFLVLDAENKFRKVSKDSIALSKQDLQSVLEEGHDATNTPLYLSNVNDPGILFAVYQSDPGGDSLPKAGQFQIVRQVDGHLSVFTDLVGNSSILSANIYYGVAALRGLTRDSIAAGSVHNNGFGTNSLRQMLSGSRNVAYGNFAGAGLVEGTLNNFFGSYAASNGSTNGTHTITADETTFIGNWQPQHEAHFNREIIVANGRRHQDMANTVGLYVKENGETTFPRSTLANYATGDNKTAVTKEVLNAAISNFVESNELSEVAFSGDYNDLDNKPTVPVPTLLEVIEAGSTANAPSTTFTLITDNFVVQGAEVNGRNLSDDGNKLDGIEAGAEVNVNADWNASSGDAEILNKPNIPAQVNLIEGDNIDITGSYPNLTISATGGGEDLQSATDNGNTTTNPIHIIGGIATPQTIDDNRISVVHGGDTASIEYVAEEVPSNSTSSVTFNPLGGMTFRNTSNFGEYVLNLPNYGDSTSHFTTRVAGEDAVENDEYVTLQQVNDTLEGYIMPNDLRNVPKTIAINDRTTCIDPYLGTPNDLMSSSIGSYIIDVDSGITEYYEGHVSYDYSHLGSLSEIEFEFRIGSTVVANFTMDSAGGVTNHIEINYELMFDGTNSVSKVNFKRYSEGTLTFQSIETSTDTLLESPQKIGLFMVDDVAISEFCPTGGSLTRIYTNRDL